MNNDPANTFVDIDKLRSQNTVPSNIALKQCMVRSWSRKFTNPVSDLHKKLSEGWIVTSSTPFIRNGETEYIEYILQKWE